jgi:hypothetical protein
VRPHGTIDGVTDRRFGMPGPRVNSLARPDTWFDVDSNGIQAILLESARPTEVRFNGSRPPSTNSLGSENRTPDDTISICENDDKHSLNGAQPWIGTTGSSSDRRSRRLFAAQRSEVRRNQDQEPPVGLAFVIECMCDGEWRGSKGLDERSSETTQRAWRKVIPESSLQV